MLRYPTVKKTVRRNRAYYDINWSVLVPVSRTQINSSVPSLSGLWELYWMPDGRRLVFLTIGRAWYGGLRNSIRAASDPTLPESSRFRPRLEAGDCYYRYSVCENSADLGDIYAVVTSLRGQAYDGAPSGRYADVRVREPDVIPVRRARKPGEAPNQPQDGGARVPNMFDVWEALKIVRAEVEHDVASRLLPEQSGGETSQASPGGS